jgi:hypothetical protein
METRLENRPVPMAGASGLLTLDMRLPRTQSAKPRARDPPSPRRPARVTNATSKAWPRAPHSKPAGGNLPAPKATNGERRCDNIASPERRTREASPSYS